jgi:prophage DNA circulation protein
MSTIKDASPRQWRLRLREASFRGVAFHVEQQGRASGRRIVLHQYPKRDLPWAEDMGRHALRYQIVGYVLQAPILPREGRTRWGGSFINYDEQRDALCAVLDAQEPGVLSDPYNPRLTLAGYDSGNPLLFACERYTMSETRERGGYAQFEMSFVEAGIPGNRLESGMNTVVQVAQAADAATKAAKDQLNQQQQNPATFDERFKGVQL